MPGVSFAGTWEIGTSSTVVWEFRSATSLASVGELGVRASILDVDALGGSASLEDGWKTSRRCLQDRHRDISRR